MSAAFRSLVVILGLLVVGACSGDASGPEGGDGRTPEAGVADPAPIDPLGPPVDGGIGDAGSNGAANCEVGDRRPCECASGVPGDQVCVADGLWSGCGCQSLDGSVYVPPPPPEIFTCGADAAETVCAPYPEPPTDYSAEPCCTTDDTCGSTNFLLVAFQCLPRVEAPPVPTDRCPDESITFVDLLGCCLPSGACGLTIDDTLPNWDIGCIERTEMREVLDQGFGRKIVAALFGLSGEVPMWEPLSCN